MIILHAPYHPMLEGRYIIKSSIFIEFTQLPCLDRYEKRYEAIEHVKTYRILVK